VAGYLPFVIYGAFAIVAAVLCLFLPETLNQKLPETIQDGIDFGCDCCSAQWWRWYYFRRTTVDKKSERSSNEPPGYDEIEDAADGPWQM
jgi:hypothetical protein